MGAATFHYSDMSRASSRAKTVADRMDDYANDLQRRIAAHLDSYTGERTANIYGADRAVSQKIRFLEERSGALLQFSERLDALVGHCKQSDQQISSMISRLTGDFKIRNDISVNPVWEAICYLDTALGNSTDIGRFLNNLLDKGRNSLDEAWDHMEFWYEYDGGKYYLTENIKAALSIAAGIAGILAAIATIAAGGTVLAIAGAIAGIVAGIFAIGNGICNIINNNKAGAQAAEDPGQAKRTNEIDSAADWLRTTDNQGLHTFATVLDATETAANVVSVVAGGAELLKKGYSWLTKKPNLDLDTLTFAKIKQDLSNGNWKTLISERWNDLKHGVIHTKSTLCSGDGDQIKAMLKSWGHAGKTNLASDHVKAWKDIKAMDFSGIDNIKDGLEGIDHFAGLMDGIANDTINTVVSNLITRPIATGTHENAVNAAEVVGTISDSIKSGSDIKDLIFQDDELKKITKRMYKLRCAAPAG